MKNFSIFAASSPKTILLVFVCVAIFVATNTASYAAETGLPIHNSCCALKPVIVFGEMWKGSLSSFKYFSFSFMPKTMKDYRAANNSNCHVTPDCESVPSTLFHETETLLKAADPQQVPQIILKMLQQFGDRIELHVHFITNSIIAGDINSSNICLVTGHDNSSISGRNNTISKNK
jgi:hypothetical protein